MDKHLELIWDYIDGRLTAHDKFTFENRLTEDLDFKNLYEAQLKLHASLQTVEANSAPQSISDFVMSSIKSQKLILGSKYDSFSGISKIMLSTLIATVLCLIYAWYLSPVAVEAATGNYAILDDYISKILSDISISPVFIKYGPYLSVLLVVPFFSFMDNYFRNRLRFDLKKN